MSSDSARSTHGLARIVAWPRVRFTILVALPFGLLLGIASITSVWIWAVRALMVGLFAMLTFGLFEQWPARLPPWLARWVLQLLGVIVAVPIAALVAYWATTGDLHFWHDRLRLSGFVQLSFLGILLALWMTFGAMVRQRDALARDQAHAFELERSRLTQQALDARLRLMQAQVQPHFLFNTLANVRALVNAGSPRASAVLDSLIAYLRAALPRLDETVSSVGQEVTLVRAYLELMQLRMPDRLQFSVQVDAAAEALRCPPMTLLTLVENAVRHGIDPSEEGGRIDVDVEVREGRCRARVVDTGVGLTHADHAPGTGLATLRERIQLAFGGDAQLRLAAIVPHGVRAELDFPAERSAP